jgi:hypothetical protein
VAAVGYSWSKWVLIGMNATSVGSVDYLFGQFLNKINATCLRFTNSQNPNATSGMGTRLGAAPRWVQRRDWE